MLIKVVILRGELGAAYLQSKLTNIKVYARIPKRLWPKWWIDKFYNPVVAVLRALYGLQESGFSTMT